MKKTILIAMFAIFFAQPALALTAGISVPPSFSLGQQIYFNYTINSDTSQQVIFIPQVFCPKSTVAFMQQKTIMLAANVQYKDAYSDKIVDSSFVPQICTASILIISPSSQYFATNFSIITTPSFSFSLNACKDSACVNESNIFLKGDSVYISYTSEVASPNITASIFYPDNSTQQISIPTMITATQTGTYFVIAAASKSGYQPAQNNIEFAAIESNANIPTSTTTTESIATTSTSSETTIPIFNPQSNLNQSSFIAAIVIIVAVVVFSYVVLRISNSKKTPEQIG